MSLFKSESSLIFSVVYLFFFPSRRSIHVGLTFNYSFSLVKNVTSQFKE